MDNIKGILIMLVVFGHFLIRFETGIVDCLVKLIYFFHMPAFIFISGYFFKTDIKRLLKKVLYPYIVFQLLLCVIAIYILGSNDQKITIFVPYGHMWYLLSLFIWSCIMPLINFKNNYAKICVLVSSIIIGLLIGYVDGVGRFLSLSRTITLLPFFLIGIYLKQWVIKKDESEGNEKTKINSIWKRIFNITLPIILSILVFFIYKNININSLENLYSYSKGHYDILQRILMYVISSLFIYSIYTLTKNKKTIVSKIGENSLQIFLLHSFIVTLIFKLGIFNTIASIYLKLLLSVVFTIIIVYILSLDIVKKLSKPLMSFDFKIKRNRKENKNESI